MSVLVLIVVLLLLGGILWLVHKKVPDLNPTIRWLINAVIIVAAIVLVLIAFGLWDLVKGVRVPKL